MHAQLHTGMCGMRTPSCRTPSMPSLPARREGATPHRACGQPPPPPADRTLLCPAHALCAFVSAGRLRISATCAAHALCVCVTECWTVVHKLLAPRVRLTHAIRLRSIEELRLLCSTQARLTIPGASKLRSVSAAAAVRARQADLACAFPTAQAVRAPSTEWLFNTRGQLR